MRMSLVVLAVFGLTLVPHPASAHHPLAELYERDRTITLTGTLTAVEWSNPHVVITVDVTSGPEERTWRIELSNPGGLTRRGWTRDQLKTGDRLVVVAHPSKDGGPAAVARTLELPGGVRLEATDDSSWDWQPLTGSNRSR